jgi:hypothetical protein
LELCSKYITYINNSKICYFLFTNSKKIDIINKNRGRLDGYS